MIEKERLKELLAEEKGCYVVDENGVGYIHLKKKYDASVGGNFIRAMTNHGSYTLATFDMCFETKEDAEFAFKYQNIERTDHLNLPTYKDFVENYHTIGDVTIPNEKCVMFNCKTNVYSLYASDNEIWIGRDNDGSSLFQKDLNKENYIEACELCKKLFLGE